MRALFALPLLAAAAACAAPGAPTTTTGAARLGCTGEVRLANASGQVVEQAYVGAPGAWGPDLLAPGTLAPGASAAFRLPPPPREARRAVRVVFDNGRAAELPGLDLCETPDVTVERGGVRAEAARR